LYPSTENSQELVFGGHVLTKLQPPRIHLPKGWQGCVKSAVLHAIALAHYAIVYARAWAADSINARVRLAAENDRLHEACTLLREELRIKDIRITQITPQRRPHYGLCVPKTRNTVKSTFMVLVFVLRASCHGSEGCMNCGGRKPKISCLRTTCQVDACHCHFSVWFWGIFRRFLAGKDDRRSGQNVLGLEATPGVEPRSTDLQAVDVDLFIH